MSVVTVKLLRVPVAMRSCCEIHPPASKAKPGFYICILWRTPGVFSLN